MVWGDSLLCVFLLLSAAPEVLEAEADLTVAEFSLAKPVGQLHVHVAEFRDFAVAECSDGRGRFSVVSIDFAHGGAGIRGS